MYAIFIHISFIFISFIFKARKDKDSFLANAKIFEYFYMTEWIYGNQTGYIFGSVGIDGYF